MKEQESGKKEIGSGGLIWAENDSSPGKRGNKVKLTFLLGFR